MKSRERSNPLNTAAFRAATGQSLRPGVTQQSVDSNTATTYEAVYDPANAADWFRPTAVVHPRFVRFNVQFDF